MTCILQVSYSREAWRTDEPPRSFQALPLCGSQLARHRGRQMVAVGGARPAAGQTHLWRSREVTGAHSDQYPGRAAQAPGKCRHRRQHPVSGTSHALRVLAYPEGPGLGRRLERVRTLGKTVHSRNRGIEAGTDERGNRRVFSKLSSCASRARKITNRDFCSPFRHQAATAGIWSLRVATVERAATAAALPGAANALATA